MVLLFTSSPEPKGQLTPNLVGNIWVTCRYKELKLFRSENQDGAMAAVLEICFALLLLNQKSSLSGNQMSDAGPS